MARHRRGFLLTVAFVAAVYRPGGVWLAGAPGVPERLSNQEFWRLSASFSELNGTFRSDNLLSNEGFLQYVIPELARVARPGRAYLGVGPEQNFTYIAAVKPSIAFIVDIRRGNLDLHLMYKALFELSSDRADFVSRLFSRPRPEGLKSASTAEDIFDAYARAQPSEALYRENLKAIERLLVEKHGFALPADDLSGEGGIEYVYHAFFTFGPSIQYSSSGRFGGRYQPSYADLMTATDGKGEARSFLSSDERFAVLKDLESRNLIVPVVGNFAGPKAIRAVAAFLKERNALVSAFYLSNVEQYLRMDGLWADFCANAATLPVDETSLFIHSTRNPQSGFGRGTGSLGSELLPIAETVKTCTVQ
ncbi:MAG TPA: hypothetical protein VL309_10500 [Vicinamibacterales bacterium]|jgi:hypothetical protein|nr:hypothetical protein [Vicinamibacterales bacterium]